MKIHQTRERKYFAIYEGLRQLEIYISQERAKESLENLGMNLMRKVDLVNMQTGEVLESWQDGERVYVAC